jgi:hypothetical protein
MHSIAIKRTRLSAILALIFMGVFAAEARPAQAVPWKWLINLATVATNGAKAWVVDKLDETVQTTGDFIGWGTGAGTAAITDTTLFTEASEARVTATRSQQTTTVTGDTVRWVGSITCAGAAKDITNAGNFTASSAGTLIVKGDFTLIHVEIGDIIEFTINLQVS